MFQTIHNWYKPVLTGDIRTSDGTVSVPMGHSSTKTTEMFYGRRKNVKAIEKVESMWE